MPLPMVIVALPLIKNDVVYLHIQGTTGGTRIVPVDEVRIFEHFFDGDAVFWFTPEGLGKIFAQVQSDCCPLV